MRQAVENPNWLDILVNLVIEKALPDITKIVLHQRPDTDAWLCYWIAHKFIPKAERAELVFVKAGEILPGSEGDPTVLHFDTGRGADDQHGKGLKRSCSAALLAGRLGLLRFPFVAEALGPLVELATKVDNVEPVDLTSIHYLIEGYPHRFQTNGRVDWETVRSRVFEHFDILYSRGIRRAEAVENLREHVEWIVLPNRLRVACIIRHPELREAAYDAGAAVVVWTASKGSKGFDVGIQVSRRYPSISLANTIAALREEEAELRGFSVDGRDLGYTEMSDDVLSGWHLHESLRLASCGTRTHPLRKEEYTRLTPERIVELVRSTISAISPRTVVRWNHGEA